MPVHLIYGLASQSSPEAYNSLAWYYICVYLLVVVDSSRYYGSAHSSLSSASHLLSQMRTFLFAVTQVHVLNLSVFTLYVTSMEAAILLSLGV